MMFKDVSRANDGSEVIDGQVEQLARAFASRTGTRHGFLGLLGKGLLGLAGVHILGPMLPVDRRVRPADPDCYYWKYCFMDGTPCANCGGSDNSCPSGCTQSSSSWTGCCYNPTDGCYHTVFYYDCCGCNTSCAGSFCNWSSEPSWCSGYHCTLAVAGGKCQPNCMMRPS